MEQAKVVIIGAGPAGSTCGLLLRQKNIDCVLIDRATFPRDKICGGGLTPRCYNLISRLLPQFRYDYNSVHRLKLRMDDEQVLDFQMAQELRIVKRRQFDAQLLEEYKKSGGTFINDALTGIEETKDQHVIVTLKSGRQIECEYLVGADGANSKVKRHLNPKAKRGMLFMEQYAPKNPDNAIELCVSHTYGHGYYYNFPNENYDVQGFGNLMTTPQTFRLVLRQMGCPDLKALGAYIPQSLDYPLRKNIILIGDACGFPNRLTLEGIYYAFLTASHAATAISSGVPFAFVNKKEFDKKKREEFVARCFYSDIGQTVLKFICKTFPGIIIWAFNKGVR